MLAQFVIDLKGGCTHLVFVDDDRDNYPSSSVAGGLSGLGSTAKERDAWDLVAAAASGRPAAPNVTLVAWPAGEGEGGSGLDADSMQGIQKLVTGE